MARWVFRSSLKHAPVFCLDPFLKQRTDKASLFGTFLQTLPDLVTPLKGQSLSPHRCPPMLSAPSERFRYYSTNKTENYMALKHECKHEAHLPQVKTRKRREFCLDWDNFGFIYAGVSSAGSYKSNARMCCENWCLFCLMKISILVLLLCVFILFQNTGNKRAQKSNFSSL